MEIHPDAFEGLENYLELLDLSENSISMIPKDVFHQFKYLRVLSIRDNMVQRFNPTEVFNGFQFTLHKLDLSGPQNDPVSLQDLRRY